MASLQQFLDSLPADQVFRIRSPIDYVPTAVVMELEKQGRSPVIIVEPEQPGGMPVVINLFGDRSRIARIAGVELDQLFPQWGRFLDTPIKPRMVKDGPVHEVVLEGAKADCTTLPISKHFAEDGGRYVSSGVFVAKDPDTGVRNLSFARMLMKAPNRFSINLGSRGDLWEHQGRAAARGKNLEVAVVIGAQPAVYLAASAKVAMTIDEYDLAGGFLGKPVDLVKCKTVDIEVPAESEIVLEGEILADEHEDEGPVAEYTGYSSRRSTRNVFCMKTMTRRQKPIYLDITPGLSSEHLTLAGIARQARDYTRIKEMIPGLKAIHFPRSGNSFHCYMSMKKMAEGEARRALMMLFGVDPYVKLGVVVDEDVDVFNEAEVLWAVATRFQADTDMFVVPKVLCNMLDPTSVNGTNAKLGIDATVPKGWQEQRATIDPEVLAQARTLIAGLKS
ncbi:MAG: UbiD family decarboxylase [Bradyrhizobiaceae bacterium]|nr:UbiD family decarboxylase [Bradyrhizobiaceae bacterium]